jgi:ankyrin repeat protein
MALMHACFRGFEGIVQLLLEAGATVHEPDDVCSFFFTITIIFVRKNVSLRMAILL